MGTRVWNLMYVLGNTGRVVSNADNPMRKSAALEDAKMVEKNGRGDGWRVWVEHHESKKRCFENDVEKAHRIDAEEKRIIKFAEENLPEYERAR